MPAVKDDLFLGWLSVGRPVARLSEWGDDGGSMPAWPSRGAGDAERGPDLKGWKDMDGLRPWPSPILKGALGAVVVNADGRECGTSCSAVAVGKELGGELVSDPAALTARRAEIGLVPSGPSP